MDVYSGAGGAEVTCTEDGISNSVGTCSGLKLHAPHDAAALARELRTALGLIARLLAPADHQCPGAAS